MEEDLGSLAWSIISAIHNQIKQQAEDEPRLLTEATRLISLNSVLNCRFSPDLIGLKGSEFFLESLSTEDAKFKGPLPDRQANECSISRRSSRGARTAMMA